jgi:hypothetical protein
MPALDAGLPLAGEEKPGRTVRRFQVKLDVHPFFQARIVCPERRVRQENATVIQNLKRYFSIPVCTDITPEHSEGPAVDTKSKTSFSPPDAEICVFCWASPKLSPGAHASSAEMPSIL